MHCPAITDQGNSSNTDKIPDAPKPGFFNRKVIKIISSPGIDVMV
ncbi:hypothetical protein FPSE_00745 [Fusarium pseudograminearum CS3096]|uniref:Uncharacterized protein n=1 Tax=Fusarium pseudograminearum (strain CS3096) TaxID=1028729 RepID=K3VU74_FUSPC|nr:hypothetical protein FPSE_00745 [Fusarium pseudograminearum CS3096]EKJ79144.1 hypothetical protein FPSE_00745 [Fusarium pseudograminearum CS3096]